MNEFSGQKGRLVIRTDECTRYIVDTNDDTVTLEFEGSFGLLGINSLICRLSRLRDSMIERAAKGTGGDTSCQE